MEKIQQEIFNVISKSEVAELKVKLTSYNGSVDFTDENGKSSMRSRPTKIAVKITKFSKTNKFQYFFLPSLFFL